MLTKPTLPCGVRNIKHNGKQVYGCAPVLNIGMHDRKDENKSLSGNTVSPDRDL